jgi:hypothetical protein
MMIIKKLEIGYGGFFSSNYQIVKNGQELVYRYGNAEPIHELKRVPEQREWNQFAEAVTPLLKTWKKEYGNEVSHGIRWRVRIETNEGYFDCWGSNDFPEDFNSFLSHCRTILGTNDFANDYLPKGEKKYPFTINTFNQKIKRLLVTKRKSVEQLANFLKSDFNTVKRQLNSMETFEYDDLIKICSYFGELPADFFYDTLPDRNSKIFKEITIDLSSMKARIFIT